MKAVAARCGIALILVFYAAGSVAAEDSGIVTDEDALFGSTTEDTDEQEGGQNLEDSLFGDAAEATASEDGFIQEVESVSGNDAALLTAESVEIGGRYSFSAQSTWSWSDPSVFFESIDSPTGDAASVDLAATLFFDARPTEDFRVYGKGTMTYPFDDAGGTREFNDVFTVEELFSDFALNDILFFRGGKHTINWGVGYFFSPADLLNLTEIDPEDPDAERVGPVSLKVQAPIDAHNLYLYLTANDIEAWDDIGVAAKAELVLGSLELGIGGLYRKDIAPSAMATASFPVWDVDVFAEAVVRYGSDRTFVEESETALFGVEAVRYEETAFFSATAGMSFVYTFDETDSSVSTSAQYLFNGEGYADATVIQDFRNQAIVNDNSSGVAALLGSGDISFSDLANTGKHYAAASAGWYDLFGSDFTVQGFWLHNFSDVSGYVSPTVTYAPFDGFDISLSTPYFYGGAGDEYTPAGDNLSVQLQFSLGGGSF